MRLSNERMLSFLSVAFALLANLLAVVGLYGVLAFVVARRTRELGIRIALGAEQGRVMGLVMRELLPVVLIGIVGGAAASLLCGRYIETQLFGVKVADPEVFLMSVGALLTVSMSAVFVPAAIQVIAARDAADATSYAVIKDASFRDGTIEVDLAGQPAAGASEGARGFIGIAFRLGGDGSYEYIYLRPTNGWADDQVRRNHSTQYSSHPDFSFARSRQEAP